MRIDIGIHEKSSSNRLTHKDVNGHIDGNKSHANPITGNLNTHRLAIHC